MYWRRQKSKTTKSRRKEKWRNRGLSFGLLLQADAMTVASRLLEFLFLERKKQATTEDISTSTELDGISFHTTKEQKMNHHDYGRHACDIITTLIKQYIVRFRGGGR